MRSVPFSRVLADAPKEKNTKVTLVYELPDVPRKSIKGVLVEYGPGGSRLATRIPNRRSSTRPCQLRDCAWGAIRS